MRSVILVMSGILILLSGCVRNAGIFSDPGRTIEVQNGNRFTIELASNATTGYSWDFAMPVDSAYIKMVTTYYTSPQTGLVGAGGIQGWVFETVQPGSTVITLEYKRSMGSI